MLLIEYAKMMMLFMTAFLIVTFLVNLPRMLNKKFFWHNTSRPVECGSQSFGSGKNKIEMIFYRVLIIFMMFEIEVLMMVPWAFNFYIVAEYSLPLIIFMVMLLFGYVYEYCSDIFKF